MIELFINNLDEYIIHGREYFSYFSTTDKDLALKVFMQLSRKECNFGYYIVSTARYLDTNVFTSNPVKTIAREL